MTGWEFDKTWYDETLVTRREWVCDNHEKFARWLSFGKVGSLIGVLIFNPLADIVGRRATVLFLSQCAALITILRLFLADGWTVYLISFLDSVPLSCILQISLIWVSEQVGKGLRHQVTMVFFVVWTAGMSIVPLLAWLTRSWVWLTILSSVPYFLFIFSYKMCESPRWLMSINQREKALKALQKISRINGKDDRQLKKSLENYSIDDNEEKINFRRFQQLFVSSKMRKWTLALLISSVCVIMVYSTLNLNVGNMGGNEFVNFFFIAIVELPSCFFGWITSETIGRRLSKMIYQILVVLLLCCIMFIQNSESVEVTIIVIAAKCLNTSAFYILYLQILEIFPTSHRAIGNGLIFFTYGLLSTSTPYIRYSSAYYSKMPYLIMIILSTVGSIAAAFIPESVGHELPQSIEECENNYAGQDLWTYKGLHYKNWLEALRKSLRSKVESST